MNLEHELFEAILENPDDLALRLIYADWCDDQGDPRGEFIRIQCELAACVGPPITVRHLKQREAELWEQHRRVWNGEIHRRLSVTPLRNRVDRRRGLIRKWEYHRGFVESVVVEARALLEFPEALFQIGPLRRVRILRAQNCLNDLMQSPFLTRLETVELNLPNLTFPSAERKIASRSRSLGSPIQMVPTPFRSSSVRIHGASGQSLLADPPLKDLLTFCLWQGLAIVCFFLCVALSTAMGRMLGALLEIVVIKLNWGGLFH